MELLERETQITENVEIKSRSSEAPVWHGERVITACSRKVTFLRKAES